MYSSNCKSNPNTGPPGIIPEIFKTPFNLPQEKQRDKSIVSVLPLQGQGVSYLLTYHTLSHKITKYGV